MITLSLRAAAIIDRLRLADDERNDARRARRERVFTLRAQLAAVARELAELTSLDKTKISIPKEPGPKRDAAIARAESGLTSRADILGRDHARLKRQIESLEAQDSAPCLTASRVETELRRFDNVPLVEVERPKPTLIDSENTLTDALARFRDTVTTLKTDRQRVERLALPVASVKEAARREVDRLLSRGVPNVLPMFHGNALAWPHLTTPRNGSAHLAHEIDAAGLLAFLWRDVLVEKLDELVDVNATLFTDAMTASERARRIKAIDSEIDATERLEAAAVESIIADGGDAFHRPDANVLAVLSYARA